MIVSRLAARAASSSSHSTRQNVRRKTFSLHAHAVGLPATESLRRVHLLGLRGRDDEQPRSRRAGEVAVLVLALPQKRREGLGPLIPQVLVLVPGAAPEPVVINTAATAAVDARLVRLARQTLRR